MARTPPKNRGYGYSTDELINKQVMSESLADDYQTKEERLNILGTVFQMFKSGTNNTSDVFSPLPNWEEDINRFQFLVNLSTGQVTIPQTGEYTLDIWAQGMGEITIKAQISSDGSTWNDIRGGIDTGNPSAKVNGLSFGASKDQLVRMVIKDSGVSSSIIDDYASFTLRRVG